MDQTTDSGAQDHRADRDCFKSEQCFTWEILEHSATWTETDSIKVVLEINSARVDRDT